MPSDRVDQVVAEAPKEKATPEVKLTPALRRSRNEKLPLPTGMIISPEENPTSAG